MSDIILTDEEGHALVGYFGANPSQYQPDNLSFTIATLAKRWQDAQPRPLAKGDIVHAVNRSALWSARMIVEHVMPEHGKAVVIDSKNYVWMYRMADLAHGERPT